VSYGVFYLIEFHIYFEVVSFSCQFELFS